MQPYVDQNKTILDLCCGVGISTAEGAMGIDTSDEMLNVATSLHTNKNKKFYFITMGFFNHSIQACN